VSFGEVMARLGCLLLVILGVLTMAGRAFAAGHERSDEPRSEARFTARSVASPGTRAKANPEGGAAAIAVKSVTLESGIALQYVEQGDADGIPVIMLHGYTDSWHSYERVLPYLSSSLHVFAMSQRGHGDSTRPAGGYDAQDFALDVAAFMDALHIGRAVIVGHSMGATIAQRFAIDQPARTLGLVLIGAAPTWKGNAGVLDLWEAVAKLEDPIDPQFARAFQESTLAQPVPAAFIDTIVQESLKVPARVWQAALVDLMQTDFSRELSAIRAPTMIFWGAKDGLASRAAQDRLAAVLPEASLTVYASAGHGLHWEEPKRFAGDLNFFVEGLIVEDCETARLVH
jgi:pimeloyl-ACP methyl ester carboxylesterase